MFIGNGLVGLHKPTVTWGDASQASTYVTRINIQAGPVWAAQIGGVNYLNAISVDSAGNVLVAGMDYNPGLPITSGSYLTAVPTVLNGVGFVCKLRGADGVVIFCTYLDPNAMSVAGVTSDAAGDVYVLGGNRGNVPATPGALSAGNRQILVMKLDSPGSKLIYAAEFGGSGRQDTAAAFYVDSAANVYIAGVTYSSDFPQTQGGAIPAMDPAQHYASFVAKVDPTGSRILVASYGGAQESPLALAVNAAGEPYIAGYTAGHLNTYVRKFTANLGGIVYMKTLARDSAGGSLIGGLAVDASGVATIVGSSSSIDFPEYQPAGQCHLMQDTFGGSDAFWVRLDRNGELLQSNFIGGTTDTGAGPVIVSDDRAFVVEGASMSPFTMSLLQLAPATTYAAGPVVGCAGNAASLRAYSFAPGEIVSLFGSGLGPQTAATWQDSATKQAPTTLSGVQVTFDGLPAPLLYVQDAQINAIVPWSLATEPQAQMCITSGQGSQCSTIAVGQVSPAVFQGSPGHAAAINQDGTLNSAQNPAPPGSIVSIFLTGLGPLAPAPADGSIISLPLPAMNLPWSVIYQNSLLFPNLGFGHADVLYAGPAPLEVAGLYQINFRTAPAGSFNYTVVLNVQQGTPPYSAYFDIYASDKLSGMNLPGAH